MKKSEIKAIQSLELMHKLGGYEQNIAQGLSALIRAAMTNKSRQELLQYAEFFGVENHPSFIV